MAAAKAETTLALTYSYSLTTDQYMYMSCRTRGWYANWTGVQHGVC